MTARWDVPAAYRASYETHASPENVAALIKEAHAEHRRVGRVVAWLEELHERRVAEKATGTWPYPPDLEAVRFPCGRSHICMMCSPRPDVPRPGCASCRRTGYDQTPCIPCAEEVRVGNPAAGQR